MYKIYKGKEIDVCADLLSVCLLAVCPLRLIFEARNYM
jgi:hypothetical protein